MKEEQKKKIESTHPPRALTRGEIKSLRDQGINLASITVENADDAVDRVVAMVYDKDKVDALDGEENQATLHLFECIVDMTYGGGETKKK